MRKLLNEELPRKTQDEFRQAEKLPVVLVLDNIRSLHNIGSVLRTADAFLLEAVYLCGITATPPHRDIHKTALGAEDTVYWKHFPTTMEAVDHLRNSGFKIFAVEQAEGSTMLHDFIPPDKTALVFGNEVNGVDQSVIHQCDGCIEIPQLGMKHSLNIAVSAGMVVWETVRRRI